MLWFAIVTKLSIIATFASLAGIALAIGVFASRPSAKEEASAVPNSPTPHEPKLVRNQYNVCWITAQNGWKCVDTYRDIKAVTVPERGLPGASCIHGANGVWRCSGLARKNYLGPDVPEPKVRENNFTSDMTGFDAATNVTAQGWFACGILNGSVVCAGDASKGQVGSAPNETSIEDFQRSAYSATPIAVPGTKGAVELFASLDGSCALMEPSGAVKCWGFDDPYANHCFDTQGREKSAPPLPCQPRAPRTPPELPACKALSGSTLYAAISQGGQVYSWVEDGRKRKAIALSGFTSMRYIAVESINQICAANEFLVRCAWAPTPAAIPLEDIRYGIDGIVSEFPELSGAIALAATSRGPCILRADGSVWCSLDGQIVRVDTAN